MEQGITHQRVEINRANVTKVYNGKARGCRCGCAGKYSYPNRNIESAGKARGYSYVAYFY